MFVDGAVLLENHSERGTAFGGNSRLLLAKEVWWEV